MARGGARTNSGPAADPDSERSERRGFKLTALPSGGYTGEPPKFPLPKRTVWASRKDQVVDEVATRAVRRRELSMWRWAWTTPQACAWALPAERWRLHTIALWVRTFVICEGEDATAADKGSLHRLAEDIGMSPSGLKANGWAVVRDELQSRRDDASTDPAVDPAASATPVAQATRRLRG